MEPHLLAIDLGTSSMKVAVMTLDGGTAGWAQRPLTLWVAADGTAEQHPGDWWDTLTQCVAELHSRLPDAMRAVVALSASCASEGIIPMDVHGEPLMPCIMWLDTRGADAMRKEQGSLINIEGYSVPRALSWLHLTGGAPSMSGTDAVGHIAYLRHHRPDVYERTHRFMAANDYLLWRLTGEWVTPWDSAMLTWTTDNRDAAEVRYHRRLVRMVGVDASQLAPIVKPTDVVGPLRPDVAELLGLSSSVKVVAGSIDVSAAAVGASAVECGDVHLYIGTSGWLGVHVERKQFSVQTMMASLPCAVPGRYLVTALQASSGANPAFLRELLFGHPLPQPGGDPWHPDQDLPLDDSLPLVVPTTGPLRHRHRPRGHTEAVPSTAVSSQVQSLTTMEQVVECAASAPPGARGLVYLPWLCGERAPVNDLSLRAGWFGVGVHHTRADMARSVFEGVVLHARWLGECLPPFMQRPLSEVTLCGGGANSPWWCQMYADVLGVSARQLRNPQHTNARGAAWVAAVGVGRLSFSDLPSLADVQAVYEPREALQDVYDESYRRFRALAKRMVPTYRETMSSSEAHQARFGLTTSPGLKRADRGQEAARSA